MKIYDVAYDKVNYETGEKKASTYQVVADDLNRAIFVAGQESASDIWDVISVTICRFTSNEYLVIKFEDN